MLQFPAHETDQHFLGESKSNTKPNACQCFSILFVYYDTPNIKIISELIQGVGVRDGASH